MARRGDYVRVRAGSLGLHRNQSLWLGPKHLLVVDNTGYREQYRRVELADIQALVVERTLWLWIRAAIWVALLLIAIGAAMTASGDEQVVWFALSAIPALVLLVDLLLGPTCKTFLRTPVQMLRLYSCGRVRRTRRLIARLRPLVEQAQGRVESGELAARLDQVPPLPDPPWQHAGFIR